MVHDQAEARTAACSVLDVPEQLMGIYKALGSGWMPAPAEQADDKAGAAPDAPD